MTQRKPFVAAERQSGRRPRQEPDGELDRLAHAAIGAGIEVHRRLGPGFLESIYEAALAAELEDRNIAFERQVLIPVTYKGRTVGEHRLDVVVEKKLILELKAVDALAPIHQAQLLSYLKATRMKLGLLLNFQTPVLRDGIQRVVL